MNNRHFVKISFGMQTLCHSFGALRVSSTKVKTLRLAVKCYLKWQSERALAHCSPVRVVFYSGALESFHSFFFFGIEVQWHRRRPQVELL